MWAGNLEETGGAVLTDFEDTCFWVSWIIYGPLHMFSHLNVVLKLSRERPAAKCPLSSAVLTLRPSWTSGPTDDGGCLSIMNLSNCAKISQDTLGFVIASGKVERCSQWPH